MKFVNYLLVLFAGFQTLTSCAEKVTEKQFNEATNFCYWYNNGTVAPECQEAVTYVVTCDSIIKTVSMESGKKVKKFKLKDGDFQEFLANIKKCGIAKRKKPVENLCCGGHSCGLDIYKGKECLFSAYSYIGGGEDGGTLLTKQWVLGDLFGNLYQKYEK